MSHYTDARCKFCKREGRQLFLKGDRCFTDKCSYERRPYPPGVNGQGRTKFTEYGIQLREKQKAKRIYGLAEKQFRLFFKKASTSRGATGENLLTLLERRLDNVIYSLGLTTSRKQARQLIKHSHFLLNGRKVNVPSIVVKKGDEIEIKEKSREINYLKESVENMGRKEMPKWLSFDPASFKGSVLELPTREDVQQDIEERLIVELYSK